MGDLSPIYLKIVRWFETILELALLRKATFQELTLSK